jgi:hypothetical protein
METMQANQPQVRVRVWFGEHAIADYKAAPDLAAPDLAAPPEPSHRPAGIGGQCSVRRGRPLSTIRYT